MKTADFQHAVREYYRTHKRILPWRWVVDPYKILVSEVMLQQTQVSRVLTKYPEFIESFPSFQSLADASLSDVLRVWQGMGYNRRGKYLKEAAEKIVRDKRYQFICHPEFISGSIGIDRFRVKASESEVKPGMTVKQILRSAQNDDNNPVVLLQKLPGIGYNTACAILTYSFNIPTVFIETNIRTVYLYHFFKDKDNVSDKIILEMVEKTLDTQNPREWYYALMDYGAYLKREEKYRNTSSKHYTKQSKFEGSRRQIRGMVIKTLLEYGPVTLEKIKELLPEDERIDEVVKELLNENMISHDGEHYYLDSRSPRSNSG